MDSLRKCFLLMLKKVFGSFFLLEIFFCRGPCFIAIESRRIITPQCAELCVPRIVAVCPWQGIR